MSIASRTPEGEPLRCPVCRNVDRLEPSFPGGDACCPRCGHLLLLLRDKVSAKLGVTVEDFASATLIADLPEDSLDTAELVMELEEEFRVKFPDGIAAQGMTVGDLVRLILGARGDRMGDDSGPGR